MHVIEFLTSSPLVFIGAFVLVSLLLGAGTDWVRRQQVRDRHKVPVPDAGKTFVADNEWVADRVREVLSEHVWIETDAIRLEDRLEDELDLDIASNPDLFFDLERAFGIDCHVDKFEVFEATTAALDTVSDVVDYVGEKIAEARTRPAQPKDEETGIGGTEIVMIGWFSGLAVIIYGGVMGAQRVMALGMAIAFVPLLFGLGRVLVHVFRDLVRDLDEIGLREILRHPLALIGWLLVVGMMLFVFAAFVLMLVRAFFESASA